MSNLLLNPYISFSSGAPAWSPLDIANCEAWFDASDASSFTYSSSTVVSQWNDKSLNARHASQGTVGKQPNRNGTQNGLSCVTFDATDDTLTLASTITVPDDGFTTFVVLGVTDTAADRAFISGTASPAYEWRISGSDDKQNLLRSHATDCGSSTSTVVGVHLLSVVSTTTLRSFYKNGTADGTNSATVSSWGAINIIGSGYDGANRADFYNGTLMEMIMYSDALGTTDRQTVEAYLKTKWGTP